MRVVFAGTPPFAAAALEAILAAGHDVALVVSQPDRPAGRGLKLAVSSVARLAADRGLALHQPPTLKSADAQAPIRDAAADVMVVAAYGLLLPQAVLDIPARGCLQHPRLPAAALARRGADPARDPGRRCRNRGRHHAHGGGAGHGSGASREAHPDRCAGDRRHPD